MATSTMATLEEVKELLLKACPGADVSDVKEERHRFTGVVRWDGFSGWSDEARNGHILREVRNKLGMRGLYIGTLYLLAVGEDLDD